MKEEHTCIKDDGGTPNRKCYACEGERKVYKPGKLIVDIKYGLREHHTEIDCPFNPNFFDTLVEFLYKLES